VFKTPRHSLITLVLDSQNLAERRPFVAPSRDVPALVVASSSSGGVAHTHTAAAGSATGAAAGASSVHLVALRTGMVIDWSSALRLALRTVRAMQERICSNYC